MQVDGQAAFRVTRDADFEVSEDQDDLLDAVEKELSQRRFGAVVRLEVDERMSDAMRSLLIRALGVEADNVYPIRGILDLADLTPLASHRPAGASLPPLDAADARAPAPGRRGRVVDVFAAIRGGDILVHHPYDSFETSVERFIEQAVDDPNVLAIKHTIYRTSGDSPIVPALARAAERGKQAVVMVEVKARFDEEKNIRWARGLERAGVHVVHGMVGLKTHCKLALIVRREDDQTRRYVHIGTGNYHPATARLYTDLGLFTCDEQITADVSDLFNQLTGFARPRRFRKLLVAPLGVRERILAEIRRAVSEHTPEEPARIVMKMNALVDRPIIDALYGASRAGVRVDLVIRGICCLRPGVAGPLGQHPRPLDPRPVPRAQPDLPLRDRAGHEHVHRLGRHDAAQPRQPDRGDRTRRGSPAPAAGLRHPRDRADGHDGRVAARGGRGLASGPDASGRGADLESGDPDGRRPVRVRRRAPPRPPRGGRRPDPQAREAPRRSHVAIVRRRRL